MKMCCVIVCAKNVELESNLLWKQVRVHTKQHEATRSYTKLHEAIVRAENAKFEPMFAFTAVLSVRRSEFGVCSLRTGALHSH